MTFVYHDGGRVEAGFKGHTGDCVTRAIAIAAQRPYAEVYAAMAEGTQHERATKYSGNVSGRRTAARGIHTTRKWFKDYMRGLGWTWVPTMAIGSGCRVHLTDGELPMGRLIVAVSKHYTAVIDGVIYDTIDSQREGEVIFGHPPVQDADGQWRNPRRVTGGRCVYGYWKEAQA